MFKGQGLDIIGVEFISPLLWAGSGFYSWHRYAFNLCYCN